MNSIMYSQFKSFETFEQVEAAVAKQYNIGWGDTFWCKHLSAEYDRLSPRPSPEEIADRQMGKAVSYSMLDCF